MDKSAIIYSREEAMAMPEDKRPICFRVSSELYTRVFEDVGAASMCWEPRPSNEVFVSEKAAKIAVNLCHFIADEIAREVDKRCAADVKAA